MSTLTDNLFDLTHKVPFVGAQVSAYLASDQGTEVVLPDGTPISPLGSVVSTTQTNIAGIFTLTGLAANVVYDLWIQPVGQEPYWITDRLADIVPTTHKCTLYGTLADAKETDIVWAFLEKPCITTDGLHISQGVTFATVSRFGNFSLDLWPTQALTPPALYRVTVGKSVYRGSVPSELDSISLVDWIALSTTQVLS